MPDVMATFYGEGIQFGTPMHHETTYIGKTEVSGSLFGIAAEHRSLHCLIVGKTGAGKSTLLRNLLVQDIEAGHGVGLIDPHGDLAEELLNLIPTHRRNDVVYFNPADREFPMGFNLLHDVPPDQRPLVASGIVSAFKSIWRDSWGPRMEYILYAAIAALLDCENVSLLGVQRMLVDARYRSWVLRQTKDPAVRAFWLDEFENYDKRFRREAIAPIQNKVGQLIMSPLVRQVIGQVRNQIDARALMDEGKIFIANLSKGRLGEDKSHLLGSLLVTAFQQAAMSRVDIVEADRRAFRLCIDEFQAFGTDSFASILSEARKYGLHLVLAHQFSSQLSDEVREAVFGNVGNMIAFRVGSADAALFYEEFDHDYQQRTFTELPNYRVRAKLMSEDGSGVTLYGRTLPPIGAHHGHGQWIINQCRQRYATPRKVVEGRVRRWIDRDF
jgi:type IV secretory pathway TraG/TraD family ATPase VirD4